MFLFFTESGTRRVYVVFDILYLNGRCLSGEATAYIIVIGLTLQEIGQRK